MNSTRHDELVEEMNDRLCQEFCNAYDFAENNCTCYIGITWGTAQSRCKRLEKFREWVIAATLKAVVDGELELPGLQLYLKITPFLKGEQEKVLGVLREELRIGDILITARPTEEEK